MLRLSVCMYVSSRNDWKRIVENQVTEFGTSWHPDVSVIVDPEGHEDKNCVGDSFILWVIIIMMIMDLSENQWIQASLPVGDGGIGIRSAQMLAHSAFLASAASTPQLQQSILPDSISSLEDGSLESIGTL